MASGALRTDGPIASSLSGDGNPVTATCPGHLLVSPLSLSPLVLRKFEIYSITDWLSQIRPLNAASPHVELGGNNMTACFKNRVIWFGKERFDWFCEQQFDAFSFDLFAL